MTRDAFTFPFTLQYVGKIPYVHEIKNIFWYGLGPIQSIVGMIGFLYFTYSTFRYKDKSQLGSRVLILIFVVSYFLTVGSFAIGFMRYMLPIYPFIALFSGIFLVKFFSFLQSKYHLSHSTSYALVFISYFILLVWPLSFLAIYSKPNTRIMASRFIHSAIPEGSTIALEHWDDSLPLSGQEKYNFVTLPMYEPDTDEKWKQISVALSQADYIILASNRLYGPLMRLTNCESLPKERCYKRSAKYYKKLFSGESDFKQIAQISSYPTIPVLNIPINDTSADESFTVYDHPTVFIFKHEN